MSIFGRLFESPEAKTIRLAKEAEAREHRVAEEAQRKDQEIKNEFLLLVVLESGMQGGLGDNVAILKQKFPGADDAYLARLRQESLLLALSGMAPDEQKARISALTKRLTAEFAAKVKG